MEEFFQHGIVSQVLKAIDSIGMMTQTLQKLRKLFSLTLDLVICAQIIFKNQIYLDLNAHRRLRKLEQHKLECKMQILNQHLYTYALFYDPLADFH